MRRILMISVTVLSLALASACGHSKTKLEGAERTASTEADGKGLVMEVLWIKSKGDSIDMNITLTNKYDNAITFRKSGWKFVFNGEAGVVSSNDFSGEMAPGATERDVLIFRFDGKKKVGKTGMGTLTIDNIEGDGKGKLPPLKFELALK